MSSWNGAAYSSTPIATRVAALGKEISREYKSRRLDMVVTLDRGFAFAADLMRQIEAPVVCHFVRENVVMSIMADRRGVKFSLVPVRSSAGGTFWSRMQYWRAV